MAIWVSQEENLLAQRKLSIFLKTFKNDSCTTSSASSLFFVILIATVNRRRPYRLTRSSNAAGVCALRASTRAASGSVKDRGTGRRSNSIGGQGAPACNCWE